MTMHKRSFTVATASLAMALVAGAPSGGRAQPFPGDKIVRIVVPANPGSPPDVVGRIIAAELAESEGWRVVVDNRPGALQSIAIEDVLNKPADGLSIFPMTLGAIATPALLPEKRLRLERDFAPVVKIATGFTVLVVHPSVPANTLSEFVALLKAQPDKFNNSTGPIGTPAHLLGEMFRLQTGSSFSHVFYQKPQQRLGDLLSGRTHFSFYNTPSVVDLVATGKLRALALAGPKRVAALKDVPSVVEEGYPNLVAEDWFGFLVKTGTPGEIIERLNAAVNKALAKQKIRDALGRLGYEPAGGTSAELGNLLASQLVYWTKTVKDSGIKMPQ